MKVVTEGNAPQKWTKRVVCKECNAVLDVEEEDLKVVNHAVAYAGETWEPEIECECAVCHSTITMTNQVPSGIRFKLMDEAQKKRNQ